MRINFDDRSYVDISQKENGNVTVTLGSVTISDGKKTISVSSAEVTIEQFGNLLSEIRTSPRKVVERDSLIKI